MANKFTLKAQNALELSQSEARSLGHTYIGSEHILLGLLGVSDCIASKLLVARGVSFGEVRHTVKKVSGSGSTSQVGPEDMTPRARRIIEASSYEAKKRSSGYIGTEHLLYALLIEKDSVAIKLIESMGASVSELISDITDYFGVDLSRAKEKTPPKEKTHKIAGAPTLSNYGKDLTALAKAGKLDPVIGRDEETARLIRILSRRNKNNPCLVGEPGVGKTAVVEGLAQMIADSRVPAPLLNRRIITLDVPSMIAGAKYRGEFEERMKSVMEEVLKNPDIILFIDEIHVIIGAGAAEGAVDAANILKPALARGEIKIIGATTHHEYRTRIEKDAALERRFQSVNVAEPSEAGAIDILLGLREKYELHHNLSISESAIRAAVQLSVRYIQGRFLPDKALDLLDEAAARVRIEKAQMPNELFELEKKISVLEREKEDAILLQDFEFAAQLRDEEKLLKSKREKIVASKSADNKEKLTVTDEDVAAILTASTGIPIGKLVEDETKRLLMLEEELKQTVIGQDNAIKTVASAIRRGRIGLKSEKRPIGSFIFLGSTGVGKTELARALAEALFGSADALVRIDMSEYMEKHNVSKLIGSPPGYVGYGEGGQLTDRVRQRPYSVVLFDEIEKAHPDVYDLLLQILDDGNITDAEGRRIDFRNTVIIMTSNIGTAEAGRIKALGFSDGSVEQSIARRSERMLDALKHEFKPEFLNRIDEIIVFNTLTQKDTEKITEKFLLDVKRRAENIGLEIIFEKNVAEEIAKKNYDVSYGARPLSRAVTKDIEDQISEKYLRGEFEGARKLKVGFCDGELCFEKI